MILADVDRQRPSLAGRVSVLDRRLPCGLGPDRRVQVSQAVQHGNAGFSRGQCLSTGLDRRVEVLGWTDRRRAGDADVLLARRRRQRWTPLGSAGRRSVPVALNRKGDVFLAAGLPERDVTDAVFRGQLRHRHGPDLVVEDFPGHGGDVVCHAGDFSEETPV